MEKEIEEFIEALERKLSSPLLEYISVVIVERAVNEVNRTNEKREGEE